MSEERTIRKRTRAAPAPEAVLEPVIAPPAEPSAGDYAVGYRKPPVATRFKPGQSGNPKGRPKHAKNLMTDIKEALEQKIEVKEGGSVKRMRKSKLIAHQLVNDAAKGQDRARETLLRHFGGAAVGTASAGTAPPPSPADEISDDDKQIVADFLRRLGVSLPATSNEETEQ